VTTRVARTSTRGRPWTEPTDLPLYPDEAEIARRVLGNRACEWPGKALILERDGLPKIDPLMGGRFWPAVERWFLNRHGLDAEQSLEVTMAAKRRVRVVPFAPDGETDYDGEKAQAARTRR
jgi:hypothetical protein